MTLIFSEPFDLSTNEVISWLIHFNKKWNRINTYDVRSIKDLSINLTQNKFSISIEKNRGDKIKFDLINSVWYRRTPIKPINYINLKNRKLSDDLFQNVLNESYILYCSYLSKLRNISSIGTPTLSSLNKISQLDFARKIKMKIPETLITKSKKELLAFRKKHKKIIMKPMYNLSHISVKKRNLTNYTTLVTDNLMNNLDEIFFPTLFQKYINKEFEIRTFYIQGKFYSMAMFSQKNRNTMVDYRVNDNSSMRSVPYTLPKWIEKRLSDFMNILTIDTGSFDLIYSNEGKYYFLEVNPVGQFGSLSYNCNYYIEKKIATRLSEMCHEKK